MAEWSKIYYGVDKKTSKGENKHMTLLIIILIVVAVILITWYLAKPKTHPVIRPGAPSHDGAKPFPMVQPVQGLKTLSRSGSETLQGRMTGSERQKPPAPPMVIPTPPPVPPMPASLADGPPSPPAPPFPPLNPPTQTL